MVLAREPRERTRIEERFVWWLWQTRRFDSALARTAGHDVIFPGWFSTAAGPDFRDAIIADHRGELRKGDVEIHVLNGAWSEHGHQKDHAYDSVILHVVLKRDSDRPTVTAAGDEVATLELQPLLTASVGDLLQTMGSWEPHEMRCPWPVQGQGPTVATVRRSGEARFRDKVRKMVGDVEALGPDEALYRLLAESLGYSANREPFRRLAEALPFSLLSSLTTFQAEEVLLAAAGLTRQQSLLSAYVDGPVLKAGELTTFRVRPGNLPASRLRGLARLVTLHHHGLAPVLVSVPVYDLWKLFVVEADTVLVGKGRADDIVINVALPYLDAYAGLDGADALARLPAPADNRWVRALRKRLTVSGVQFRPYRAVHQQGILDLALRFCRYDHCEACPLHQDVGTAASAVDE